MRPRIVYVHGSGPKPRAELLRSQWDRALFGRDMEEASHLAYYASLLHPEPLPDPVPDPLEGRPRAVAEAEAEAEAEALAAAGAGAGAGTAGAAGAGAGPGGNAGTGTRTGTGTGDGNAASGSDTAVTARAAQAALEDPAHFVARTAHEPRGGALGGWLRDMTYLAEALALAEEPRPGQGEWPLPEALPLPRPARTALFRRLVKHSFEDTHAYFFGGRGRAMRQAVSDALDAAGEYAAPLVVVAHSLGSVIAYEVLAARNPKVDLFVTLGSPLGVTEVQDCLAAPPAMPSGTALWLNVSDARDVVALDHTLRPEYAPPGRITDLLVRNAGENHHGITEYLSDPLVREPVRRTFTRVP
ncbi:hypothetical protein [Streptomyces sp. TRM64462]|uniref:hypothetical protein n=1 Tax=Streptomyces sp. TRM64462 TaxID=2741726 RepID=UPI001586E528|nr:hypothetical protein [Streptomyces sp. TRM64462]